MSNRVMKMDKEPDVKHIKKVMANSSKATSMKDATKDATKDAMKDIMKDKDSAGKSATKVFGMPCLPQHSD